ncbi:MAG: ATP-dependent zinc metalloprotease FtsH [Planctomycetota bacterium]
MNDGNKPPEGGPRGGGQKKAPRFSFGWVVLVLLLVLLVSQFLAPKPEQPDWQTFTKWVAEGQLEDLVVSQKRIVGKHILVAGEKETEKYEAFEFIRVYGPEKDLDLMREANLTWKTNEEGDGLGGFLLMALPFLLIIGIWFFLMRRMNPGQQVMSFGKSKAKIYAEKEVKVDFGDVAGVEEAVEEVREIVDFLREPEKFQTLGARIPKGVLLLGAPGTGKTLLARAVAGEAQVPFFTLSGSDFVEMFVGVGASRVRDLFKQAAQNAPCIVFIDELDALGKTRGTSPVSNDEREQTLNALLVEMDGFDANSGVIIIAATNRPEILDAALMRPGRFDRQIVVDKPDIKGREQILEVHAKNVKLDDEVDLKVIAARTPGFAGADLANVINEAALLAARRDKKSVTMGELEEAIDRTIAGLEKKKRLMTKKDKEIVAYHETGHALVATKLPHTDPVHRISIIPRGMGALGHTLQLPTDERYLMTLEELSSRMAVLLGGRAAEIVVYGQVSTGAHNDIERVSKMARRMVTEYGMSAKMGPISWEQEQRSFLWADGSASKKDFSEVTGREIDEEVMRVVTAAETLAVETLKEHRDLLETVAQRLMEIELIEAEEFRALVGDVDEEDDEVPEPEPSAEASDEAEVPDEPESPDEPEETAG